MGLLNLFKINKEFFGNERWEEGEGEKMKSNPLRLLLVQLP